MSRIKMGSCARKARRNRGLGLAEAKALLLRAQLLSEIRAAVRTLPRAEATQLLAVAQARLDDALRGRSDKFSLDDLVRMLAKAGMRVEVRVERAG